LRTKDMTRGSVPYIVEADVKETSLLEYRREATLSEIGRGDWDPGCRGEDDSVVVVEIPECHHLSQVPGVLDFSSEPTASAGMASEK
jgi:hypothetical protein